jgi:hypothetical protein
LRRYPDTATPTFIVRGSQYVGSRREIDYFAPRYFAAPAERNVYAPGSFAFKIELNLIETTLIINREEKSTFRSGELGRLKSSRRDGYELCLNGSLRPLDHPCGLAWRAFEVCED